MRRYCLNWMNGSDGFSLRRKPGRRARRESPVSRVTRIAASTIGRGLKELDAPPLLSSAAFAVREGMKSLTETDPGLLDDPYALVEGDCGDPNR